MLMPEAWTKGSAVQVGGKSAGARRLAAEPRAQVAEGVALRRRASTK